MFKSSICSVSTSRQREKQKKHLMRWATDNIWMTTDLDVLDQDVVLELGMTGTTLSLTAWPAESIEKPATPQLTYESDLFSSGSIGVFLDPNSTSGAAAVFRFSRRFPLSPEISTQVTRWTWKTSS